MKTDLLRTRYALVLVAFWAMLTSGCGNDSTSAAATMTDQEKQDAKKAQEVNASIRQKYGVAVPGGGAPPSAKQ
jgi:hypothetical protein